MVLAPTSVDRSTLQRRVVRTLVGSQVLSGVGLASGIAVGALLAEDLSGSEALAGVGTTAQVLGTALLTIPVARATAARGRRVGLRWGLAVAFLGAALVLVAAVVRSFPLFVVGMFLFGGGTTANNQTRYAAADLATPARRGRDLSTVVWATTIGSVAGPNLVGPGRALARAVGLPELVGTFVFSLVGFALAWVVVHRLLRPDPLLTARALDAAADAEAGRAAAEVPAATAAAAAAPAGAGDTAPAGAGDAAPAAVLADHDGSMRRGLRIARSNPRALQAMVVMALGHLVMVSVMVMTPIHMKHGHAELEVIGFVISVHILGMYALSPLVGAAVDRWGPASVAVAGGVVLTVASALAARSQAGWSGLLLVALFLLGVGWSCTLVSGSTLLTSSVATQERPAAQGLADVLMGLAGAGGGVVAGVVIGGLGYAALASGAAVVGVLVLVVGAARVRPADAAA
ncbi:MFS transporter [Terrabacter sp. NPDC000476]|uniref:MFS transporter n=1 Tax=Terrabacter sp. NPDC000476 TaxID=3154258 RepID=UPI003332E46E